MKPSESVAPLFPCWTPSVTGGHETRRAEGRASRDAWADPAQGQSPALPPLRKPPSSLDWLLRPSLKWPPGPPQPTDAQPFIRVSPTLVRGRRPRIDELDRLKTEFGIKTIINIEDRVSAPMWFFKPSWVSSERLKRAAETRGITVHRLRVSCITRPSVQKLSRILDIMDDPGAQPVYLHCYKGLERTNFIIAMHRIFREHADVHDVYCDMLCMGFRRPLVPMLHALFSELMKPAPEQGVMVGLNRTVGALALMVGAREVLSDNVAVAVTMGATLSQALAQKVADGGANHPEKSAQTLDYLAA